MQYALFAIASLQPLLTSPAVKGLLVLDLVLNDEVLPNVVEGLGEGGGDTVELGVLGGLQGSV